MHPEVVSHFPLPAPIPDSSLNDLPVSLVLSFGYFVPQDLLKLWPNCKAPALGYFRSLWRTFQVLFMLGDKIFTAQEGLSLDRSLSANNLYQSSHGKCLFTVIRSSVICTS